MRRRRRRLAIGVGLAAASTASVLLAVGIVALWPEPTPAAPVQSASTGPPLAAAKPKAAAVPTPTPARTMSARQTRKKLTRALDHYLRGRSGELSLSIRDLSTGITYTYRPKARTATASIVKVEIMVTLLLKAQREHRPLTSSERALATQMIEFSDNNAANSLWFAGGGSAGLAATNKKLRLRSTTPGPGGVWGATTTSAADQIRILRALTSARGPLTTRSRRYILGLMSHVTSGQAWGVSAGAVDRKDAVALKNGWLPRPVDGGRWTINSIGRVRTHGHDYLIAVLTRLNPSMGAGVQTVEHATRLVTSTLRTAVPPPAGPAAKGAKGVH
jgi:beta-lactamase class A